MDYDVQISKIVSSTLNKEFEKLLSDIKRQLPHQMMAIKNEVFTDYSVVVKSVFKTVFDERYGITYDQDALMSSIDFHYGIGMLPYFTIDESKFSFAPNFMRDLRKLNENEDESGYTPYSSIRKRMIETNSIGKIKGFFDNSDGVSVDEDWYDGVEDIVSQLSPRDDRNETEMDSDFYQIQINVYNLKRENNADSVETLSNISNVYAVAKMRAEQEALRVYNTTIKPRIYKKYGLKI